MLTTSLGDAFRAWCQREGVDYERLRAALRKAYGEADPASLVARFETGRIEQTEFERELAAGLSEGLDRPVPADRLIVRMIEDLRLDGEMVAAVRAARSAGVRTALLSNSWGVDYYPHDLLANLFDEVVISGRAGVRKPDAEAFRVAARGLGLEPAACVFVDDLASNVEAAQKVGMRVVLHKDTARTIEALEDLLRIPLREVGATLERMTDLDLTDPKVVDEHREQVQLLDVREPFEWDAGRIEGAVHIPLQELLDGRMEGLDQSKPVVIYCRTANRSEVARMMLEARGYQAHVMAGGSENWVAQGLPLTTPDGRPGRVA